VVGSGHVFGLPKSTDVERPVNLTGSVLAKSPLHDGGVYFPEKFCCPSGGGSSILTSLLSDYARHSPDITPGERVSKKPDGLQSSVAKYMKAHADRFMYKQQGVYLRRVTAFDDPIDQQSVTATGTSGSTFAVRAGTHCTENQFENWSGRLRASRQALIVRISSYVVFLAQRFDSDDRYSRGQRRG
jgi:hypothetical protein